MDFNEQFKEYFKIERTIEGLDNILIDGVPLWRIVRLRFRWKYLQHNSITVKTSVTIKELIVNNIRSLFGLSRIIFGKRKVKNIFFPHPRLFWVNGKYMERLSDPLIEYSDIKNDYLILERHQNGVHRRPRLHANNVVYLDVIDSIVRVLRLFASYFVRKKYSHQISELHVLLASKLDKVDDSYKHIINSTLTEFLLLKKMIKPIMESLSPQVVFLAPRATYLHVIDYCKKNSIITVELQHGVTVCETDLYSGSYCNLIDPDYFFLFGEDNKSPFFYIPYGQQINIGFPYKNFVDSVSNVNFNCNTCLVISDPEISSKIVNIICELAEKYEKYTFHIRCHPQEKMPDNVLSAISKQKNVMIVDNKIESFYAISQYDTILGENSTVLYEAMSLHKRIGRFNYGGLRVIETENIHGGYKINSIEDFDEFMRTKYDGSNDSYNIYSDFNPKTLMLIK